MKLTTIALAIAFALPTTVAYAEGPMNLADPVTRPYPVAQPYRGTTAGASERIATRPWNVSGNTLAPIAHDPSGSTLTGAAVNRIG